MKVLMVELILKICFLEWAHVPPPLFTARQTKPSEQHVNKDLTGAESLVIPSFLR